MTMVDCAEWNAYCPAGPAGLDLAQHRRELRHLQLQAEAAEHVAERQELAERDEVVDRASGVDPDQPGGFTEAWRLLDRLTR